MRADRAPATRAQAFQERALGGDGGARCGVVDRGDEGERFGVVRAHLDAKRALPDRGRHLFDAEDVRRLLGQPETVETGHRQHDAVALAGVDLRDARRDVAADVHGLDVRAQGSELDGAAGAAGADAGAPAQLRERAAAPGDERIAHVGALRHGRERQALGQQRRQVLQRVHGDVDLAREQRALDRLCEDAKTSDLRQRRARDVALRRDLAQLRAHVRT